MKRSSGKILKRIQKICSDKGWKLQNYNGSNKQCSIVCQNQHEWQIFPTIFSDNTKCDICVVEIKIKIATDIAIKKGGNLINQIDNQYGIWSCKRGHKFKQSFCRITNNDYWCTICN